MQSYDILSFGQYHFLNSAKIKGIFVVVDGARERHVVFPWKYKL